MMLRSAEEQSFMQSDRAQTASYLSIKWLARGGALGKPCQQGLPYSECGRHAAGQQLHRAPCWP